jgi:hypothetical protein
MDSMTWLWMYLNWAQDIEEKHDFATDYSIFLGSFTNADAAKTMSEKRKPKFDLSDDDFEKSTERVIKDRNKQLDTENQIKSLHRRKRRKVLQEG